MSGLAAAVGIPRWVAPSLLAAGAFAGTTIADDSEVVDTITIASPMAVGASVVMAFGAAVLAGRSKIMMSKAASAAQRGLGPAVDAEQATLSIGQRMAPAWLLFKVSAPVATGAVLGNKLVGGD